MLTDTIITIPEDRPSWQSPPKSRLDHEFFTVVFGRPPSGVEELEDVKGLLRRELWLYESVSSTTFSLGLLDCLKRAARESSPRLYVALPTEECEWDLIYGLIYFVSTKEDDTFPTGEPRNHAYNALITKLNMVQG